MKILYRLFLLLFLFNSYSFSQENEHQLMNEISFFIGETSYLDHQGNYFSPGIEYTRRFSEHILLGVWAEAIMAKNTEWTLGIPLYLTHKHFWLRLAPGIEILKEEIESEQVGETEIESKTEFLFRTGIGYTFHLGNVLLTPSFDVDFVRSTVAAVFGISIGYGF